MLMTTMKDEQRKRTFHKIEWSGVQEAITQLRKRLEEGPAFRYMRESHLWQKHWIGRDDIKGYDALWSACSSPWKEGMDLMAAAQAEIAKERMPTPHSFVRKQVWAEQGDHYDLDRHRAGAEPWRTTQRTKRPAKQVVTLYCKTGGHCSTTGPQLVRAGAAAVALSNVLEAAGYVVEIVNFMYAECFLAMGRPPAYLARGGRDSGDDVLTIHPVKEAGKPVTLPVVVNASSAWFYRTVVMMGPHVLNPQGWHVSEHYGFPVNMPESVLATLRAASPGKQVYVMQGDWSRDCPMAAAKGVLASVLRQERE